MNNRKIQKLLNVALIVAVFFFSNILFYGYINCGYSSDFGAHINGAMSGQSYSLMGILIYVVNMLFKLEITLPIVMSLLVVGTILLASCLMSKIIGLLDVASIDMWELIPVGTSGIFLCSIYIPKFWMKFYTSTTPVTQPWHNSTYILVRLVAVAVLLMYFQIEKKYIEKIKFKDMVIFTVLLILTNASKPNFILAFSPMMLVFLICDFIITKGKSFKNAFKFGICVLLSLIVILFQTKMLYVDDSGSGIAFTLEKFYAQYMTPDAIIMIIANLAFPIFITVILLFAKPDKYSLRMLIQGWVMYIIARLEGVFLTETGPRAADGNFSWGSYLFAYLLYIVCISEWIAAKKKGLIKRESIYFTGWAIYILNIATGIIYFWYLCEGAYYIF